MVKSISIYITLAFTALTLLSCNKEVENTKYSLLINKEWYSTNGITRSCHFYPGNEYRYILELAIIDTETNQITFTNDTFYSYWKLEGDLILFSSSLNFSENPDNPLNWSIIELTDNQLKVKYVCDLSNPYIFPMTFSSESQ